jgi:hypothetical protein
MRIFEPKCIYSVEDENSKGAAAPFSHKHMLFCMLTRLQKTGFGTAVSTPGSS